MAILDKERKLIVIRVVYDGPPEAGKTTSLRALAHSLGQELHTPAESDGRTLYFDWLDYTAGRFEGCQIRCQVVSVPGQPEYISRRRQLLRDADVIVCVADTGDHSMCTTVRYLQQLPAMLAELPAPSVGVVLQANKRDLPDAVPLLDLQDYLHDAGLQIGVVESVAADGLGVREAFVLAVRLALDRVRELLRSETLGIGRPEIEDATQLLAAMQATEQRDDAASVPMHHGAEPPAFMQLLADSGAISSMDGLGAGVDDATHHSVKPSAVEPSAVEPSAVEPSAVEPSAVEPSAVKPSVPRCPDPAVPSGAIWPPVEGRIVLHAASTAELGAIRQLANGAWAAGIGSGWRTLSHADAEYEEVDQGRAALVRWARVHAMCSGLLSRRRCIVLAESGQSTWRLWQIVRAEPSLADSLEDCQSVLFTELIPQVVSAASVLVQMTGHIQRLGCHLPCTLDLIAVGDAGPVYVGQMPPERMPLAADHSQQLVTQLNRLLGYAPAERRDELRGKIGRQVRVVAHGEAMEQVREWAQASRVDRPQGAV